MLFIIERLYRIILKPSRLFSFERAIVFFSLSNELSVSSMVVIIIAQGEDLVHETYHFKRPFIIMHFFYIKPSWGPFVLGS